MFKLIDQGSVAIVGGFCSGATVPESDVARRHGAIPFIATISSNPKFTEQGYANVFRIAPRDDQAAVADASYIREILKAKKVAILHDNTTYSKSAGGFAKRYFENNGIDVVYFDALTPAQSDYSSVLTRISTYDPDVLYYSGYYPEFGALVRQWAGLGLEFRLHGGGSTWDPVLLKTAGPALGSPLVSITTTPMGDFSPGAVKIADAYRRQFGTAPGTYATWEYDGVLVLAAAIKLAGSTDAQALNKALRQVDYQGLTGPIKFDAKGDRGDFPFIAINVQQGNFTKTAHLAGNRWITD